MLYPWRKTLQRLTLTLTCLLLLNGCATKLAYNFLDWATLWYIESYVSLDAKQKQHAKDFLDEFHHWHRTTQLPRYALYMEGLQLRLSTGTLTGQQMHDETDQLQVLLETSLNHLTPLFVTLAASFSDKQVDELLASLAKERRKYQKQFVDVNEAKLHKARIEELKDHLQLAISSFNAEQQTLMQNWSHSLLPFESLTLKQQELWATELQQAMENRQDRAQLDKTLRKLLFVHTDHWDEELERRMDVNQEITYKVLAQLINSLTPKQRKKMNNKILGYVADFRELAVANAQK